MKREIISTSSEATLDLGERLGRALTGGEIILLTGDLGAGKTLLTRGIARGLGLDSATPVVSPTFTLVNVYQARLDIVHVDLYRLEADELCELGLEDFMDEAHVMVVEWADLAGDFFRGRVIEMQMEYLDAGTRRISLSTNLPLAGFEAHATHEPDSIHEES